MPNLATTGEVRLTSVFDASPQPTGQALAGLAGGTGVAGLVVAGLGGVAGLSSATGGANNATVSAVGGGFVAGDWGTVIGEYDFSDTGLITASGGAVSSVTAKSGSAGPIVQATGSRQPTTGTRTQNSQNVLDFDGGDLLSVNISDDTQPFTLVAVCASDNVDSGNRQAWGVAGGAGHAVAVYVNADVYRLYSGSAEVGGVTETAAARVLVAVFNGASSALWVDGVQTTGSPGTDSLSELALGGDGNTFANFWNGWIGHAIAYTAAVADPSGLSGALNSKWACY